MEGRDDVLDVDVGLLIKLVQNFPHIYDNRHKNFKNSTLKENTWKRIAAAIKVPVEDCLRVWKNLRDKFTRERRNLKIHPHNCDTISKWEFYDAMAFLNPYIKRRQTRALRNRPAFIQVTKDNLNSLLTSNSKIWDPVAVKMSPEPVSLLEGQFEDDSGEMDEVIFDTDISDTSNRSIDSIHQPINIARHQTSEEAFGAYIATRLMEFPPEVRQIKKLKLFKDLEEPEEIS